MQLAIFESDSSVKETTGVVNVSSVPQRSPFRYPGGKTWLIPIIRKWLKNYNTNVFVEPFLGGGIVSLTVGFENLAKQIVMVELDEEVASVWQTIVNKDRIELAKKIIDFELNSTNINTELQNEDNSIIGSAFKTILKNRVFHGGIITKGAGLIKNGENGKGISSRWYPITLSQRILAIEHIANKLNFYKTDGFSIIEQYIDEPTTTFFIDPPYTLAGKRLYTHYNINHERLFELCSAIKGRFMLTYDDTPEVRNWIEKYNLSHITIPMKTTHHVTKSEIIVCDSFEWQK